ncbi:hypothetical protein NCCP28_21010 [Niallia sp. NCCP-28]|nr:hypothetical protein NCCP28_21010 [Niallia sp. NCCP-28]
MKNLDIIVTTPLDQPNNIRYLSLEDEDCNYNDHDLPGEEN